MNSSKELEELRREVREITGDIIRMIARRNSLASKIAQIKESASLPIVDESVEEELETYVLRTCRREGVSESAGLEALAFLLKESKRVQAQRLAPGGRDQAAAEMPSFRRVAVIGCSGGMGSFLVRYFTARGCSVSGADPRRPSTAYPNFRYVSSNAEAVAGADLVVVASPLESTTEVIEEMLAALPDGCLLMELSSVKGPLGTSLSRILDEGRIKVISLHPMFGPSVERLKGAAIVLVPVRDVEGELLLAKEVFPDADFVILHRNDHDMAVALSLALTHAANLAFCRTLARHITPEAFRRIAPPFAAVQLSLAEGILMQDPHLYSQIQVSNRFTGRVLETFNEEFEGLRRIADTKDRRRFEQLFLGLRRSYRLDSEGRDILGAVYRASEQVKRLGRADDPRRQAQGTRQESR